MAFSFRQSSSTPIEDHLSPQKTTMQNIKDKFLAQLNTVIPEAPPSM
jgi:hypothetical protein